MLPEDTATETVECKAVARFVVGYRLGVIVTCQLSKDTHFKQHVATMDSIDPSVHRDPKYPDVVNIAYYWPGEFKE